MNKALPKSIKLYNGWNLFGYNGNDGTLNQGRGYWIKVKWQAICENQ